MLSASFNDRNLQAKIDELKSKVDKQRILNLLGAVSLSYIQGTYTNETDPYGLKWQALSIQTIRARRKKGAGAKILKDTGNLFNSANYQVMGSNVHIGFNAAYSQYHQAGSKNLPQRAVVPDNSRGLPARLKAELLDALDIWAKQ